MTLSCRWTIVVGVAVAIGFLLPSFVSLGAPHSPASNSALEVWVIDHTRTSPDGGGVLAIYLNVDSADSTDSAAAVAPEVIDLARGAGALCLDQTGSAPSQPHTLRFNQAHTHALLSFVETGHILVLDAASRSPLACLDAGPHAHAVVPVLDASAMIVTNGDGTPLHRITTDYTRNTFIRDHEASLEQAACAPPTGCDDLAAPDLLPLNAAPSTPTDPTIGAGLDLAAPHHQVRRLE